MPARLTKSGIMLGMGEEWDEVITCLRDLRRSDVNIVTLGQYLRPSDGAPPGGALLHTRTNSPNCTTIGMAMGFKHVQASPLTRSSYHAWEQIDHARACLPERPNLKARVSDGHNHRSDAAHQTAWAGRAVRRPLRRVAAHHAADPPLRGEGRRGLLPRADRRLLSPLHRAGSRRRRNPRRARVPTTTW